MRLRHAIAPLGLAALLAGCGGSLVDHANLDVKNQADCGVNLVKCGNTCITQVVTEPGYVCGISCQPCAPTGIPNSTPTCTPTGTDGHNGVCGYQCDPGLLPTAAGCSAPKLVAAGASFSCATASDTGEVYCWGDNGAGQLGPGVTDASRATARKVDFAGLTNVTALAAGPAHVCAVVPIANNTTVYCWGDATGWGDSLSTATPVAVAALTGVTKLTAGLRHTCGLKGSALQCAGAATDGGIPTSPLASTQVLEVAAGDAFTCALVATSPPSVQCWGDDTYGQLGGGAAGAATGTPRTIAGIPSTIQHITAGSRHACASNNQTNPVWCWGDGTNNQLGPTIGVHLPPTNDANVDRAVSGMTAGLQGTCAVMQDPTAILECWSRDPLVAGGTALAGDRNSISFGSFGSNIGAISMGADHACFVETAVTPNKLHCFGHDLGGQLGDGATTDPTAGTVVSVIGR